MSDWPGMFVGADELQKRRIERDIAFVNDSKVLHLIGDNAGEMLAMDMKEADTKFLQLWR